MSTTRREFVHALAIAGAVTAIKPAMAGIEPLAPSATTCAAPRVAPTPIVSFFMDQPYLDMTGDALPYVPPAGLRSAQPSAQHTEFLLHHC